MHGSLAGDMLNLASNEGGLSRRVGANYGNLAMLAY